MQPVRPNFLPNQQFIALHSTLEEHLGKIAHGVTPEIFSGLCDAMILRVIKDAFRSVCADEGSIWIVDSAKENLVVAYDSGPRAAEIVGFRQPLSSGIVSMVLANEQGFVENEVFKNTAHSDRLDGKLQAVTYAMIVTPFYFLNACRGVVSCVQLIERDTENNCLTDVTGKRPGFRMEDLAIVQSAASIVTNLVDYKLLKTTVGWNQH